MARFPEQFIQQVAQATDIVELIGQYVALKKRGKEFVGLCPFHDDHKPSMYVSPAKQIYKCFACSAGGGVYQFMMGYEKMPFTEAVRMLADRAGIPIPQDTQPKANGAGFSKNELTDVTTFAARFYRDQLHAQAGAGALEYARERKLTDESIARFGVGFAPDSWNALIQAARNKGHGESHLVAAGLAVRRESGAGCYDRLRNRLIFPIIDPGGRVVAFAGRALDEAEPAKYLNTAETILFDKSASLYALNWSRQNIAGGGQAIVVEGYLDALIPIQMGVENVVATMGTSLTNRQVRLLSRYAREVVVVFDSDEAGTTAAERALELFIAQHLHVRVATIPTGKDPCDFCLSEGAEAMRELVASAPDALQYVWGRRQKAYEDAAGNLADRHRIIEEFLRLVVASSAYGAIDQVRRGQLVQHIGHILNVAPADLEGQMRRLGRQIPRSSQPQQDPPKPEQMDPAVLAERQLLEVLVNREDLYEAAAQEVSPNDFSNSTLRSIAEVVWSLGQTGKLTVEQLVASEAMASCGPVVTDLITSGQRRGNHEQTLDGAVKHLLYRRNRQEIQELKRAGLNDETLRQLNQEFRQSDLRRHPKIR